MIRFRTLAVAIALVLFASLIQAQEDISARLTFTTIDVPGAMNTVVAGINSSGEMVGWWYNGTGATGTGFLLSQGNFTFLNYPGGDLTEASQINDSGLIAGTAYYAQNTASVGFLYDGTSFTTISVPGATFTIVNGINNADAIVGGDVGSSGNQGFELIGQRFRNITPPPGGYIAAYATGVNNLGRIVGWTTSSNTSGFLYKGGKFQTISVPGNFGITEAWDINDSGIVVGWYEACSPSCADHGFVLMKGKYLSLDYPGAMETYAFGLNNAGQIVGSYTLDQQTSHGFVTSPITAAVLGN